MSEELKEDESAASAKPLVSIRGRWLRVGPACYVRADKVVGVSRERDGKPVVFVEGSYTGSDMDSAFILNDEECRNMDPVLLLKAVERASQFGRRFGDTPWSTPPAQLTLQSDGRWVADEPADEGMATPKPDAPR